MGLIDYLSHKRQAVLARQHADGGAAHEEVFHHLPGHVAREGRHPTRGQAVVASKDDHLRLLQVGRCSALDLAQAQRKLLQSAQ